MSANDFFNQIFISVNKVYVRTFQKGKSKIWVYNKADLRIENEQYQFREATPERKISQKQFHSEAILHQRREVIKRIQQNQNVNYKKAVEIFNIEKENIKNDRIEGIMATLSMNRKNATLYYNDLIDKKKFTELKSYGNSPNLEIKYRF